METNKIAVVIPYFKKKFFEGPLLSLASQTDKRFTVYIGDDCSPEDPTELIQKYVNVLNIRYKKFETNIGSKSLVAQWNRCIDLCENEDWFMILGDDDYISANFIECFYSNVNTAEDKEISVIKTSSKVIDEENNTLQVKKDEPLIKSSIDYFLDKVTNEGRSSLTEHIYRFSAYKKHGFKDFPLAWHSDDLSQLEFSEYGNILFIKEAAAYIRVSSLSISGSGTKLKDKHSATKMFLETVSQHLKYFNSSQLRLFFNYVNWVESDKDIKVLIKNKRFYLVKAFGLRALKMIYQ